MRSERFGNFRVRVDARLLPPFEGGLLHVDFRHQPNGDRYSFVVNPHDGAFALRRIRDGRINPLIPATVSEAIQADAASNRLGVRARGNEIVLYVNGQEVGRAQDDGLREGWLSLGVSSLADARTEGRFANLVVMSVD
jgi:hypothetical protein